VDMRFPAVAGGEGINRSGGTCQRKGWGRGRNLALRKLGDPIIDGLLL